jgi:DNA-directed RNA polymerase subunit delta
MKRVIVDYSKLTSEILNLLVEKFPDGYDDSDIVRFKNAKNESIEAVEVRTEDTIYLVKVSTKLADRIENYDEDEELEGADDSLDALKELEIEDGADDDDDDKDDAADVDDDGDDEDVDDIAEEESDDDDEE